jgi:chromosome segregation ATPase
MPENLSNRLEQLEKSIKRAADTISHLKAERDGLADRVRALEADRGELLALRQERKDVLGQLDSILKELEKLDL